MNPGFLSFFPLPLLIAFPWNLKLGFWNFISVAVLDVFLSFIAVLNV